MYEQRYAATTGLPREAALRREMDSFLVWVDDTYCLTVDRVLSLGADKEGGGCWLWKEALGDADVARGCRDLLQVGGRRFVDVVRQPGGSNQPCSDQRLYLLFRPRPYATPIPYLVLADVYRMCSTCDDEKWSAVGSLVEAIKARKTAPQRPRSAFLCFTIDKREGVLASNPQIKFGEIAKEVATLWKNTSEEEKKPHEQLASGDKQRYEAEHEAFRAAQEAKGGGDCSGTTQALLARKF